MTAKWIHRAWVLVFAVTLAWVAWTQQDRPYDPLTLDAIARDQGQLVDQRAPSFELTDLEGRPHTLASLRGRVVFLNFWASWCEPCRDEMPSMVSLAEQLEGRDFVMVAASLDDDDAAMRALLAETGVDPAKILVLRDIDGAVAARFGTQLLPETYLIDRDGVTVARYAGPREWERESVRQAIERILVGQWRARGRG